MTVYVDALPTLPTVFLGTHLPNWLGRHAVPMFVSHRRLAGRKMLPRARAPWALDSGGFSELSLFGEWRTKPADYVAAVRRYASEIGALQWAAIQDWMCEPFMLRKTNLTVAQHQFLSVTSYLVLRDMAPDVPWAPSHAWPTPRKSSRSCRSRKATVSTLHQASTRDETRPAASTADRSDGWIHVTPSGPTATRGATGSSATIRTAAEALGSYGSSGIGSTAPPVKSPAESPGFAVGAAAMPISGPRTAGVMPIENCPAGEDRRSRDGGRDRVFAALRARRREPRPLADLLSGLNWMRGLPDFLAGAEGGR